MPKLKKASSCHPDRLQRGRGLCPECYFKDYSAKNSERNKKRSKQHYLDNKDKYKKQSKEWFLNNRDAHRAQGAKFRKANPEYILKHSLKYKYGISLDDYSRMLAEQEGVCAICRKVDPNHRLSVDHNHVTNSVRGLLCGSCNRGIGMLKTDSGPDLLLAALEYQAKWSKKSAKSGQSRE